MSSKSTHPGAGSRQRMGGRGPMGHGMAGGMPGDKAKNFKGTLKKLLSYLSRYKLALLLVVVCAIASTVFAIVGPTILGNATTERCV